jgi:hypothetical protein
VTDNISRYGAHKFSPTRAPKVLSIYAGAGGWQDVTARGLTLTKETARDLAEQGFTMVRVRWRFNDHDVSLTRYLGRA